MQLLQTKVLDAIRNSQYKQLALYIRHNYNLNVTTNDGRNGLFIALDIVDARKRRRMLRYCLDHGIDPSHKENINGFTVLNEAIARQQLDSIQLLLAYAGGEIDWRSFDARGRTILHQAVESNNISILDALITVTNHYGISVDIPDSNGLTPFLLATKLHIHVMAQLLVQKGHASRRQCDAITHRSANDWNLAGIEEHRLVVREQLRRQIEEAMKAGKINKAKKLRAAYYMPWLAIPSDIQHRRDSIASSTMTSTMHNMSSMSINEMIDRLPEGDIPESFVTSEPDNQTFHLERIAPRPPPPPAVTSRQGRSKLPFNTLVDLFQVATDQLSPSYRTSINKNTSTLFDQHARKKASVNPHRSTLAVINEHNRTSFVSTSRQRRSSNIAVANKRVA